MSAILKFEKIEIANLNSTQLLIIGIDMYSMEYKQKLDISINTLNFSNIISTL